MLRACSCVIALAVMLVGLPTAQAAEETLTLACQGTMTETSFGQRGEAERLSTGILVNFTDRTVKGLVDPPVKITTWNEVSVTFRSSYELPPSVVTTFGTIDRVTGDLEAFSGQRLADQDASTHGKGRWVYRDVDGRKCWFPAGRLRRGQEKP